MSGTDLPPQEISDEMVKLYRDGWNEPPIPTPPAERVRAGLAAVLAGCEVRERWAVRWYLPDGGFDEQDCRDNARETAEQRARRLAAHPPIGAVRGEAVKYEIHTVECPVVSDNKESTDG